MLLKAVTITDIAIADGRSILYYTYVLKNGNSLWDHYTWPRPPLLEHWIIFMWQKALQPTFFDPHVSPTSRRLKHSLQVYKWNTPSIKWHSYIHTAFNLLYQQSNNVWAVYSQATRNSRHPGFTLSQENVDSIPLGEQKMASLSHKGILFLVDCTSYFQYEAEEPTDCDFNPAHHSYDLIHDAFEDAIDCPQILIDHIDVPTDCCKVIAASIQQGTARAVSDGS